MNKAQYTSATVNGSSNGLYPLSTQGLEFIQNQIELLQKLSAIGGTNYILKQSSASEDGVIVLGGEVMPLSGTPQKYIIVMTDTEDITADGDTYKNARKKRYAKYAASVASGSDYYVAANIQTLSTNLALQTGLDGYSALASKFDTKLTVETYNNLTRSALDKEYYRNVRLHCRKGCVVLNGAEEYTVNVYRNSDETVTQEQLLPDMTRFIREWDFSTGTWGDFYKPVVKESLHLEVKVVSASKVYVRHGEIPSGVQLVLLRKKKRSGKRRSGGANTTNAKFIGLSKHRQPKNQYCHYKGIVLTLGTPNKWYVPKVQSVGKGGDWDSLVGKELTTVCKEFIQEKDGIFRVRNTRHRASDFGQLSDTKATLHVKMGLQLAVSNNRSKTSGGEMVQMLYRIWWDHTAKSNGTVSSRRRWGFSVV